MNDLTAIGRMQYDCSVAHDVEVQRIAPDGVTKYGSTSLVSAMILPCPTAIGGAQKSPVVVVLIALGDECLHYRRRKCLQRLILKEPFVGERVCLRPACAAVARPPDAALPLRPFSIAQVFTARCDAVAFVCH